MSAGLPDVGRLERPSSSEITERRVENTNGSFPPAGAGAGVRPVLDRSLSEMVSSYERWLIEEALRMTRGNRARAARLLQTTERILGYRIRQYGIDWKGFRR